MSDQALKTHRASGNGIPEESATVSDVTGHASELAHDLVTLTELQARLLYCDVREAGTRSAGSVVALAAMLALALSSIPVLLLGLGELLARAADWPVGAAYLLVGAIAALAAGVAGWITFKRLRRVTKVFERTQQELEENLDFVKSLLKGRKQPASNWQRPSTN